jgi:hypothetical protein
MIRLEQQAGRSTAFSLQQDFGAVAATVRTVGAFSQHDRRCEDSARPRSVPGLQQHGIIEAGRTVTPISEKQTIIAIVRLNITTCLYTGNSLPKEFTYFFFKVK